MKTNVSNMPLNKLYKFADDSFVWSTMLTETRGRSYIQNEPMKFTEVYRIDDTGFMKRAASGKLVDKQGNNDYEHRFVIHDYDNDMDFSFFVETPFEEANLDDLYKMREAVTKSDQEKQK